jgi:FkbM family methyltransferase
MSQLRQLARKYLPDPIRKPLGSLAGTIDHEVLDRIRGALFDLGGRRFKADGCTIEIPTGITSMKYRACFLKGDYEAEERELVRAFVKPSDRVLEVGACLGIVSCVTNRLLADKSRHVVVEGNPFCIPAIHRNREINQAGFLIENCAISDKREVTFFLHPVYVVGGTTLRQSNRPVRVPTRTLAEMDQRYGPFTTLIMDTEGSELEIFEASQNLFNNYRLVIVELHEWAVGAQGVQRCRDILTAAGLRFRQRAGITEAWERD